MLTVSAAHERVLLGDYVTGAELVALRTHTGTRHIALGDRSVTVGSQTYDALSNLQIEQTAEYTGLGSARYRLTTDASRKSWFIDSASRLRVADIRADLQFALYDPKTKAYLAPFVRHSLVADSLIEDGETVVIALIDLWGDERDDARWVLSKDHQRRIAASDTSMDGIAKRKPPRARLI